MLKSLLTPAPRLAPAACTERLQAGTAVLIDVREPHEWEEGVARSAHRLALSDLRGARTQWGPFLDRFRDHELLLYCASGIRSGIATRLLIAEGFRAANTGGLGDWLDSGWPLAPKPRR